MFVSYKKIHKTQDEIGSRIIILHRLLNWSIQMAENSMHQNLDFYANIWVYIHTAAQFIHANYASIKCFNAHFASHQCLMVYGKREFKEKYSSNFI